MAKKTTTAQKGSVSTKATAKAAREAIKVAAELTNQKFANGIVKKLDALSKAREQWEVTDFKKANDGLYQLLAECLEVYTTQFLKATKPAQKAVRKELAVQLTAAGGRVLDKTSVLMMLVRLVFNTHRQRAHGYATVLGYAIKQGIAPADLPAFITQAGGIEEIKRSEVKTEQAKANKAEFEVALSQVKQEVEAFGVNPLATVEIDGLSGTYALLLVKPNVDGTAAVVGSLSDLSEALVESVVVRIAKARIKEQHEDEVVTKADQDHLAASLSASNDAQMKKAA